MQLTGHVIIQLSKCSQNSLVLQITNLSVRLHIPTCASINLYWGGLCPSRDWACTVTPELSPGSCPLPTQHVFSARAGAAAACPPTWELPKAKGNGGAGRAGSCGPACPGTALPLPLPLPLQDAAMKLFFYLSSFQFRLRKICAPLAPPQ